MFAITTGLVEFWKVGQREVVRPAQLKPESSRKLVIRNVRNATSHFADDSAKWLCNTQSWFGISNLGHTHKLHTTRQYGNDSQNPIRHGLVTFDLNADSVLIGHDRFLDFIRHFAGLSLYGKNQSKYISIATANRRNATQP